MAAGSKKKFGKSAIFANSRLQRALAVVTYAFTDGAATLQRANSQAERAAYPASPSTISVSLGSLKNLEFEEICGRLGQYDGRTARMSAQ